MVISGLLKTHVQLRLIIVEIIVKRKILYFSIIDNFVNFHSIITQKNKRCPKYRICITCCNHVGNIKEFAGNWDAVWDNIQLRGKLKETLMNMARQTKDFDLLEAPFVITTNDKYHKLAESVKEEVGTLDSQRIFFEWNEWLKREVKKRQQNI